MPTRSILTRHAVSLYAAKELPGSQARRKAFFGDHIATDATALVEDISLQMPEIGQLE